MHGRMCLLLAVGYYPRRVCASGVKQLVLSVVVVVDSVHHVAYARHVANVLFYVEMGVKGAGSGGGLDVWGVTSQALMMRLVIWLKHYFGVLVIFDCCFVMTE